MSTVRGQIIYLGENVVIDIRTEFNTYLNQHLLTSVVIGGYILDIMKKERNEYCAARRMKDE